MSDINYMKLTYHGPKKIKTYLNMTSPIFDVLRLEINLCLFDVHKMPKQELRYFWIDDDNDEIEIVSQCDYIVFRTKCPKGLHMQVAPITSPPNAEDNNASSTSNAQKPEDEKFDANAVHKGVECDSCKTVPIVGFRYKCIQCPDFDLCERCESEHKHPNHMLIRMPHDNCPNVIETWITGRASRRGIKRSSKIHCPMFAAGGADCGADAPLADDAKDRHHHHRHGGRRSQHKMRPNFIMNLYDMMQDLAETGGVAFKTDDDAGNVASSDGVAGAAAAAAAAAAPSTGQEATNEVINDAATTSIMAAKAANEAAAKVAAANKVILETVKRVQELNMKKTAAAGEGASANTNEMPTRTSTPNSSKPEKQQSKETNTENAPSTFGSGSPSLENLAQYVDPQYMKAGIQILNNFSEMFAKMLDPTGDVAGASGPCPFQYESAVPTRKNSTTSNASGAPSTATSSVGNENIVGAQNAERISIEQNVTAEKAQQTPVSVVNNRPQSEENDWQLIDNQPASDSFANLSASTSIVNSLKNDDTLAADAVAAEKLISSEINFAQLSKDLRDHVEREQQQQQPLEMPPPAVASVGILNMIPADTFHIDTVGDTVAPEPSKPVEEKRAVAVFHADAQVNNAVHAMIAMGFSNEGAWLTQLLESVNGNIPAALDLMSNAQDNSQ